MLNPFALPAPPARPSITAVDSPILPYPTIPKGLRALPYPIVVKGLRALPYPTVAQGHRTLTILERDSHTCNLDS